MIGMSSTSLATVMSLGLVNVASLIAYFFTDLRKGYFGERRPFLHTARMKES